MKILFLLLAMITHSLANLYDGAEHVEILADWDTFEEEVLHGNGVWMVQFYSPASRSSKGFVHEYKRLAEIMSGTFHAAVVDVSSTDIVDRLDMDMDTKTFPPIYFWGDDKENPKPMTFEPGEKNRPQKILEELMRFGLEEIQARAAGTSRAGEYRGKKKKKKEKPSSKDDKFFSKVVRLTSENFEREVLQNPLVALVAFTAPWCGHCKRLAPNWEDAAQRLDGSGAFLGWVDATVETELAEIYDVKGYPTIKLFPGGNKSHSSAVDYEGDRNSETIVAQVLAEVEFSGVPQGIPQLTSQAVLQRECSGRFRICILAALPHILDSGADGRNDYLNLLTSIRDTFEKSSFHILWLEGGSQPDFEQALDLTFGFPAVVAVWLERKAHAVMRGSFREKSISAFLNGVADGHQSPIPLSSELPEVVMVEPWDGKDGTPIEEEIPLADVMGWDDEDEDKWEGEL